MLTIELIPRTSWFDNLRAILSQTEWDRLRKATYRRANYECEICGGRGEKWPVECHEVWQFDDARKIQSLVGLTALCPSCHSVKHIGRTKWGLEYGKAREHLAKVNGWTVEIAEYAIQGALAVWEERSRFNWQVDYAGDDAEVRELLLGMVMVRAAKVSAQIGLQTVANTLREQKERRIAKSQKRLAKFTKTKEPVIARKLRFED